MSIKKESPTPIYAAGEKVLCFHGPLLYEAKCLDVKINGEEITYFVHYQGWNKNWDEWVTDRRMYKYDEAGLRKHKELEKLAKSGKKMKVLRKSDLKNQPYPPPEVIEKVDKSLRPGDDGYASSPYHPPPKISEHPSESQPACSDARQRRQSDSTEASETESQKLSGGRHEEAKQVSVRPTPSASGRKRKGRPAASELTGETDDGFSRKARIHVNLSNALRAWLVDDWDLTTKQSRLFVLPARKSVASILEDYLEQTAVTTVAMATDGDAKAPITQDLRQEFAAGIRVNFNFILGSQLLYKFERPQYADMLKAHAGKEMVDIYGPMHLLRLLVKLKDMITFVKVDPSSVAVLESLVTDFIGFLEKNMDEFFQLEDYTTATPDYLRLAMC